MSYTWMEYLDIEKEIEPGWFKFKWKPVRQRYPMDGTWNIYTRRGVSDHRTLGFKLWKSKGYNWCCDTLHLQCDFWWWGFEAWVSWNFTMSERGPADTNRPLDPEKIRKFRESQK